MTKPQFQPIIILLLILFAGLLFFFLVVLFETKDLSKKLLIFLADGIQTIFGKGGKIRQLLGKVFILPLKILLKIYEAICRYRRHKLILLATIGLSVMVHLGIILAMSLCAQALGITHIALPDYFFLTPLGLITTAIPIAPAGIGVGHAAFGVLYKTIGAEKAGINIFNMWVLFQVLVFLFGIIFWLLNRSKPNEQDIEDIQTQKGLA
jgi:hypothetical protein